MNFEFGLVDIDSINVDPEYQRDFDARRVQASAKASLGRAFILT